jgi:hypothetical protein
MTTCFIKYIIDPSKIADFEHYGKLWIDLVNGWATSQYCLTKDTLLFLFRRWQITKFIGTKFRTHQDVLKHLSSNDTKCIISYERNFLNQSSKELLTRQNCFTNYVFLQE